MTFTTRHPGASTTCTGGLTMVHLFSTIPSEVEICDTERGSAAVKVIKTAGDPRNPYTYATVVYLDWETAKQIAELVTHRLEQADSEDHDLCAVCGDHRDNHDADNHRWTDDKFLRLLNG
jgi:hypothetical protein